jgi:hypothetical protein
MKPITGNGLRRNIVNIPPDGVVVSGTIMACVYFIPGKPLARGGALAHSLVIGVKEPDIQAEFPV